MATAGEDPKVRALREARSLHPRPEAVRDERFSSSEFLDARDLVQVKYEMVRRARVEGESVSRIAETFEQRRITAVLGPRRQTRVESGSRRSVSIHVRPDFQSFVLRRFNVRKQIVDLRPVLLSGRFDVINLRRNSGFAAEPD